MDWICAPGALGRLEIKEDEIPGAGDVSGCAAAAFAKAEAVVKLPVEAFAAAAFKRADAPGLLELAAAALASAVAEVEFPAAAAAAAAAASPEESWA